MPRRLGYEILEIPAKWDNLKNHLAVVAEFNDPPDYCRARNYADLGRKASAVTKDSWDLLSCRTKKADQATGTAIVGWKRAST